MRKRKPSVEDDRIKRLEEDLSFTRHIVLKLMTDEARKILLSYRDYKPSDDYELDDVFEEWSFNVTTDVMELAQPLSLDPDYYLYDKSLCPLCGIKSSAPYAIGFTMGGLRRHLEERSKAYKCEVMAVACELAIEYWKRRIAEAKEQRTLERKRRFKEARKLK